MLCKAQSGFRTKHSCETALLKLIDGWMEAIDKGKQTGAILLDLRKAYDLVDHRIMIAKLKAYKFTNSATEWFASYLNDRKQYVQINCTKSSYLNIVSGVPQGSILGPLLFLLYINDFELCLKHCKADMYADDSTFHVTGSNLTEIQYKLSEDADNISLWCKNNKMVINTNKTSTMLICSRPRQTMNGEQLNIAINGHCLSNVNSCKILGVKIDCNLLWHEQVSHVCNRISSRLALLRRIRPFLDKDTSILFYKGYILPFLDYCCLVWGSCNAGSKERILKLQKSAARIILNASYHDRSGLLFDELGWKTFDRHVKQKRMIMVYKIMNGLTPSYLKELFTPITEVHNHSLRSSSSNNFYITGGNTDYHRRRFNYIAAKEWNDLNPQIKSTTTLASFKEMVC